MQDVKVLGMNGSIMKSKESEVGLIETLFMSIYCIIFHVEIHNSSVKPESGSEFVLISLDTQRFERLVVENHEVVKRHAQRLQALCVSAF